MENINIKTYFKTIGIFTILLVAIGVLSISIESVQIDSNKLNKGYHLMTYYMKDSNMYLNTK